MQHLWLEFVNEWSGVFCASSFFSLFIAYLFCGKSCNNVKIPDNVYKIVVGYYGKMSIFLCVAIIDCGFFVSSFVLKFFCDAYVLSVGAFFVYFVISMIFFKAILDMSSFKSRALFYNILCLLIIPFALLFCMHAVQLLASWLYGETSSLPEAVQKEFFMIVAGCAFFLWPWALFFAFSKKVKVLWKQLEYSAVAGGLR